MPGAVIRVRDAASLVRAYARVRDAAGLPPYRGRAEARPGLAGPVTVLWDGDTLTLWIESGAGWVPAPAGR